MIKGTITLSDGSIITLESNSPSEMGEVLSSLSVTKNGKEPREEEDFNSIFPSPKNREEYQQWTNEQIEESTPATRIEKKQKNSPWTKDEIKEILQFITSGKEFIRIGAKERKSFSKMFPHKKGTQTLRFVQRLRRFLVIGEKSGRPRELSPKNLSHLKELGLEPGTYTMQESIITKEFSNGDHRIFPGEMLKGGKLRKVYPWSENDIVMLGKTMKQHLLNNDLYPSVKTMEYMRKNGEVKDRSNQSFLTTLVGMKDYLLNAKTKKNIRLTKRMIETLQKNGVTPITTVSRSEEHSQPKRSKGYIPFSRFFKDEEIQGFPTEADKDEV